MPTRKLGYLLTVVGGFASLATSLMDLVIPGNSGVGASQFLGMQVSVAMMLIGIFLAFLYPSRDIDIRSMRAAAQRILDLPVIVWVLAGFALVYLAFFISPVFYNVERSMWYFNRFIPNKNPIGVDIQAVMRYIEDWLVAGQSPYADGFIAYPPLALVLFAPLMLIGYPAYYFVVTTLTLFFHLGSALIASLFVQRDRNFALPLLVFGLSLFSYGFQFELERGQFNVIAFSLCLIGIYIFHAHAEFRYFAYLLFTAGVQLKIYPVILIVMFIKDWRDWTGNLKRLGGLALVNFGLLFVLGSQFFSGFVRAVSGQQSLGSTWNGNHSLKGFVNQLVVDGLGFFPLDSWMGLQQSQRWIELSLFVIIALCFLTILFQCYLQNSSNPNPFLLLACTVCALIIPSISNDYKLPILAAPVAAMFLALSLPALGWRKIITIALILIASMAYWSTQFPFSVKPPILTRNFPALLALLLAATALSFVASSGRNEPPAQRKER